MATPQSALAGQPETAGGRIAALDAFRGLTIAFMVLVNDPAQRKLQKQDRSSFEREWTAAGKWTLLALPNAESR